jgi:hypothetical protein
MAIPTITSITPNVGPASGRLLVDVAGSGFALPPLPEPSGMTSRPKPSVAVYVAGKRASLVRVRSESSLTFLLPVGDAGAADVTVQNLDAAGNGISGESVTFTQGFQFHRPALTIESDLARLVRNLLRELKRQVHPNVSLTVQTDYDAQTGDELHIAELAQLPALVLVGPELSEDRFYSVNELVETAGSGRVLRRRSPYTVDLRFTLVGTADHTVELLNLMAATQLFFHKNKFLEMNRDETNPELGQVRYEMDIPQGGDFRHASGPNEANLRNFSGAFVIRGFDFEDMAGIPSESVVEETKPVEAVVIAPPEPLPTAHPPTKYPHLQSEGVAQCP